MIADDLALSMPQSLSKSAVEVVFSQSMVDPYEASRLPS